MFQLSGFYCKSSKSLVNRQLPGPRGPGSLGSESWPVIQLQNL